MSVKEAFSEAIELHRKGQLEQASLRYRAILAVRPQHAAANHNLGKILREKGAGNEALPLFQAALKSAPQDGQHWLSYATTLMECGRARDALKILRQGIARGLKGRKLDTLLEKVERACEHEPDIDSLRDLEKRGRFDELEHAVKEQMARLGKRPELEQWLGVLKLRLGQNEEALAILRNVTTAAPDNFNAWNQTGVVLNHMEQFDEAHDAYLKALSLSPDNASIMSNIGKNLNDSRRYTEALEWLDKALAVAPASLAAHCNRLGALVGLDRDAEAQKFLREFNFPDGQPAEIVTNFATSLRRLGEVERAEQILNELLGRIPGMIDARLILSHVLNDKGDFAKSHENLELALRLAPGRTDLWAGLAQVRKMTKEDAAWEVRAQEMLSQRLTSRQEMPLRYAMGKFCDDTGQYAQAFEHYRRAAELKKQSGRDYDRNNQAALVQRLRQNYSMDRVRRVRAGASDSQRPVLIVGMPRSGTSLTEQILASHPDTYGAGELAWWQHFVSAHQDQVLACSLSASELETAAAGYLKELARYNDRALRVVDKMPGNFHWLGIIHQVFPKAKILHTMRNPVDTGLSIFFQNFNVKHAYANDLEDIAHYYRLYHQLMAHWREVIPPENLLDVPYEQLVEDQEGWSRRIIEFIGLDWDESCLEFYKTERKVGTASNWQARQPIYKSSKERWRNYESFVGPLLPLLELYGK